MKLYKERPRQVEVIQYTGINMPEIEMIINKRTGRSSKISGKDVIRTSAQGHVKLSIGDYVVCDNGFIAIYGVNEFDAIYEVV